MAAIVFQSALEASEFAAEIDGRLSYPKDGVDIGEGIHAPKELSRTLRHGAVMKHPKDSLWAYPDDSKIEGELGKGLELPATAEVKALDDSWFPKKPDDDAPIDPIVAAEGVR